MATTAVVYPPGWTDVALGVRWRGVRVPFTDPPPEVIPWGHEPRVLDWVVVRMDLAHGVPVVVRSPDDHLGGVTADPAVLAAVDAGYFEPDYSPSGLLTSNGVVLGAGGGPAAGRAGTGVLTVSDGLVDVVPSVGYDHGARRRAVLELQCGPRLVEHGAVAGVYRDDGRRYARTVACVREQGHTLDLVTVWDPSAPMRGPGLYQLARMLTAPSPVGDPTGCDLALNLDGGPSTGVYVRGGVRHDPLGPTPWLLEIRR